VTLGGSDGSALSGAPTPGKVIGPSFAADEVVDVMEALVETYKTLRTGNETFIGTYKRVGAEPYKDRSQRRAPHHRTARASTRCSHRP
jgi:sulfite reductase (NADPH) hemoprotein beta-component